MSLINDIVAWFTNPLNWQGPNGIPARMFEHILISVISLAIALAIALPAGIYIGHTRRGANFAVNVANIGRALPSLAVIGIVWPLTVLLDPQLGFKVYPTLIAMVILAIPPILVNAHAGLTGVDQELTEAGRGMGMREHHVLTRIELPLAVPVIVVGIRSAGVQIVATATLGAIFGFGGLGRYLVDGYAQRDEGQIFGGMILVAGLAITVELGFVVLQRLLTSRGLRLEQARGRGAAASINAATR